MATCADARRRSGGFTLIEAAVAIAVVAILAGAIAPLALKAITQQREARTREACKGAFEALFGAKDRRVANMRADFGWNPGGSLADLSAMLSITGTGMPGSGTFNRSYSQDSQGLFWGWNGPYWSGTTDSANRPLDGWGRPLQLRWVNGGWQVFSFGADGASNTGAGTSTPQGDDLGYPLVPAAPASFTSVLYIQVDNTTTAQTGTLSVYDKNVTNSLGALTLTGNATTGTSLTIASNSTASFICNPLSGGVKVTVTRTVTTPTTLYYVVDLLPGEVKTLNVSL